RPGSAGDRAVGRRCSAPQSPTWQRSAALVRRPILPSPMRYAYVAATVLLTVYGQLVVKWKVGEAGDLPAGVDGKLNWVLKLVVNPWIISVFAAAAVAAASWFLAISHWELSRAYPFVATSFILVLFSSAVLF